ncbi:tRNA (adenosine(37)-N6)-threonylcarbamoyltransferase complex transferase subunit TsaD [Candidatus Microgenomates bacterium]|nr:tRNA (adenosine(37)-N6)-threonylcarbamoyltransferase complex transferase subunit TsaD [Candidatus Microgenomates bacterium]
MLILGIETSCDETAASVVEDGTKVLSHVLATSADMHTKTGGIIPEVAAREQLRSIIPVVDAAISNATPKGSQAFQISNIDAIAVTAGGPGLIGSLLVGVETAKTLAYVWDKPIVPVVHILAHLYANWLMDAPYPEFPAIVLTVSGGHTELILMRDHGDFQMLGGTRDDSAGETFDKTARLLGLPYPGGPSIQKAAKNGDPSKIILPRPMKDSGDFDFSFSGLKTAAAREVSKLKAMKQFNNETISHIAASVQEAIADVLSAKAVAAVRKYGVKSLLVAGGVAANNRFRELLVERSPVPVFIPPVELCTDNGSFIASFAYFNYNPRPWSKIIAIPDADEAMKVYAKIKS